MKHIGIAEQFKQQIRAVAGKAPLFPQIHLDIENDTLWAATKVRVLNPKDNKWYRVTVIESHYTAMPPFHVTIHTGTRVILEKITQKAYQIMHLWNFSDVVYDEDLPVQELDTVFQITERERMEKLLNLTSKLKDPFDPHPERTDTISRVIDAVREQQGEWKKGDLFIIGNDRTKVHRVQSVDETCLMTSRGPVNRKLATKVFLCKECESELVETEGHICGKCDLAREQ